MSAPLRPTATKLPTQDWPSSFWASVSTKWIDQSLSNSGSGFRQAGIELVTYRVIGSTHVQDASVQKRREGSKDSTSARIGREKVYWREIGKEVDTDIYGSGLASGMTFDGPAIIRFESTTALIHPGQTARIDSYGNVRITSRRG